MGGEPLPKRIRVTVGPVTYLGRLDSNVEAFVERCQRIIFEGPLEVEIARAE
jgi:hypothetical protein